MVQRRSRRVTVSLEPADRRLIGELWLGSGLYEHASIASFSTFLLQAMQLGAPPSILRRTIRAMDDEVRHSILCFRLAARFLGVEQGPGPFVQPISPRGTPDEAAILAAVIEEGCVSETIAVAFAADALERTSDPDVRAALEAIVADEREHSQLAWDFVAWMIETRTHLAGLADATFARCLKVGDEEPDVPGWSPIAESFGHLSAASKAEVRRRMIERELRPRAAALAGGGAAAAGFRDAVAAAG